MKKLVHLVIFSLVFMLSGCVAVKKHNRILDSMENLVINAPAQRVYDAAVGVVGLQFSARINATGKYSGASSWRTSDYVFGGKVNQKKTRTLVTVNAIGQNKSKLRIETESMTNFMGDWGEPHKMRYPDSEYKTLQRVNPGQAANIEKAAELSAKK